MDAGLTAVLGAAVGGLFTAGGSWLTGRAGRRQAEIQATASREQAEIQARAPHAQWRREVRREAYSAFMAAMLEAQEATGGALTALTMEEMDKARAAMQHAHEVFPKLRSTLATLALEGPEDVAAAAEEVLRMTGHHMLTIDLSFNEYVDSRAREVHKQILEDAGLQRERSMEAFTQIARAALDT